MIRRAGLCLPGKPGHSWKQEGKRGYRNYAKGKRYFYADGKEAKEEQDKQPILELLKEEDQSACEKVTEKLQSLSSK
ncbi:hypothetical protein [Faecalibaculum rodentium]|jgi:hypothetical protein|uniref:hypothetical protein n=1 Tax=Faecalibaculum rodentium TaxID=1702221 RepID=UPI0025AF7078|nr:hypothetical protein [Faecalibaculum rodentium]